MLPVPITTLEDLLSRWPTLPCNISPSKWVSLLAFRRRLLLFAVCNCTFAFASFFREKERIPRSVQPGVPGGRAIPLCLSSRSFSFANARPRWLNRFLVSSPNSANVCEIPSGKNNGS